MKKKILIVAVIVVALAAAIGIGYGIGHSSKKDDGQTTKKEAEVDSDAVAETSAKTETKGIHIDCQKKNSWEESGKTCTQVDVKLQNETKDARTNWEFTMDVPEGTKVKQSWNAKFTISGTTLKATAVDFNQEIPGNGEISFGLILAANEEVNPANTKVLIDGKELQVEEQVESTEPEDTETEEEPEATVENPDGTVVKAHGKLSVKGTDLVDAKGNKVQLKGISTHGLAWFPEYVNREGFKNLRDLFGINTIRLAMYSDPGAGYSKAMHKKVREGVKYASELGMYVIIDWHILSDSNPNQYKDKAKAFFKEMSKAYGKYDNVIYEICNEPNGSTTWEGDIKKYANEIIPVIRKNAKDAVIIVGTPTWSQDVDIAANSPLKQKNIMYALHFYASTHKENIRQKLVKAHKKGLPVFISEFSICEASGNGTVDYGEAKKWVSLMKKYNLSYMAWNLSNKDEKSSLIKSGCSKKSGWTEGDLSETGKWLLKLTK